VAGWLAGRRMTKLAYAKSFDAIFTYAQRRKSLHAIGLKLLKASDSSPSPPTLPPQCVRALRQLSCYTILSYPVLSYSPSSATS
jgi:hypothetical protein